MRKLSGVENPEYPVGKFTFSSTPVSIGRPPFNYHPAHTASVPFVSIVTPFYNTGEIFHETAKSIFYQSFQQWEWIIVNDGSTNAEALAILNTYRQQHDNRIRVIDLAVNQGISAARNRGYAAANSDYVVQLDSDDLLAATAIEKWLWFLLSYPEFAFVKGFSVGFGAKEYLWDKGFHWGNAFLYENLVDPPALVKRQVHQAVGGYDETNRAGLEDWDFWLHCANLGFWGGTIPEYLNWYRCRKDHTDRWSNLSPKRLPEFRKKLQHRYPALWKRNFPQVQLPPAVPTESLKFTHPCENLLEKNNKGRILMILPWLAVGGADKFNLDLLQMLTRQGWEVSIATTLKGEQDWLSEFSRHTPDIFILNHFLRLEDYPRFLTYLIQSRQVDIVFISHSELGYRLLPFLHSQFPEITFVDYCHIAEEYWKNGGYPRFSLIYQEFLEQTGVSSHHLKNWMVERGKNAERVQVMTTNIDSQHWKPDLENRSLTRTQLGIPPEKTLILYTARLCEQKQPLIFAQTLHLLRATRLNFFAVVLGNGEEMGNLRRYLVHHHLTDCVRLEGEASNQQVQQWMTAADIFFLPSKWEGISLACYEAMACGLPIVSADVGGQRELVTPECGILVRPGGEDEAYRYAAVLETLIRDETHRRLLGEKGRHRVEEYFQIERLSKEMEAFFLKAQYRHHEEKSLSPVSSGLAGAALPRGNACAIQALEKTRLEYPPHFPLKGIYNRSGSLSRGETLYLELRRIFLPVYNAIHKIVGAPLIPLKDRIKAFFIHQNI
jgi:glycosyltransferase involved in cell wall biosynthesis